MRSFIKIITIAAVATLAVVAQAQEIIDGFQGPISTNSGDKFPRAMAVGGFNPLSTLAEGPYPVALRALPPVPMSEAHLQKRQCSCPGGNGCCTNGASAGKCCPVGELCSPAGGCCASDMPYTCNSKYCCPYASCTNNGCGCPTTEKTCGTKCCVYGCNASGLDCGCPTTHPVACSDNKTCCPSGTTCVFGGKCMSGGGSGNPDDVVQSSSGPRPTGGSGGGSGGGPSIIFGGDAAPGSKASAAMAVVIGMAAVFVA